MPSKDYRKDWAQEAARQKMRELKGKGWSNVKIGNLAGVSGVYIGSTLREEDPKPVSRKVWDALLAHTNMTLPNTTTAVVDQQTEKVSEGSGRSELEELKDQLRAQVRLTNSVLDRLDQVSDQLARVLALIHSQRGQ